MFEIMELAIPDYLFTFNTVAGAMVLASVLYLIWFGAARRLAPRSEHITTASILSVGLLGWFVLAEFIGRQNIYWAPNNPVIPTIQFGLLIPLTIALVLLLRSVRVARLIDAIPLSWLVGVQFYRALGFMFLVLWSDGYLPWQFALPAGIGDIAAGVLAVVVAVMIVRKVSFAHSAAYAWCLFGIADLMVAVTMGTLTTPGRIHLVALDAPNWFVSAYPLVMVPTFAVPVSIILHVMCLWKLRRMREQARPA